MTIICFKANYRSSWKFINEKDEIVHFDKYNLHSPEIAEDGSREFDFLDQQRFRLKNGKYQFELVIQDLHSERIADTIKQPFEINFYPNILSISDIEMLESYKPATPESKMAKSGYDLIPKIDYYYGHNHDELQFYVEIYNADEKLGDKPYLLSYFIQSYETKQVVNDFKVFKRQMPEETTVLIGKFPISELHSGNYNLVIEIRDQKNLLLGYKETYFQRNNAKLDEATLSTSFESLNVQNTFASRMTDKEVLMENISSLRPASSPNERIFEDNQLKMADVELMQKFFYDYWVKRNPANPEGAWLTYFEEVKKVNNTYGTRIQKGYETDCGRVYLEYGPPNTISSHKNEPSAYPYEIWHYYKLGNQSNRKFIFYNPDLVSQDYRLLHSDANGELSEPRWQYILNERNNANRNMDKTKVNDSYGGRSDDFFNNPR